MKKEALELVRKIFNSLKWDIPHPDLEEVLTASKSMARLVCNSLIDALPQQQEKYESMIAEIDKITFKQVYQ